MLSKISFVVLALASLSACDRPIPTGPKEGQTGAPHDSPTASPISQRAAMDRLARRIARALDKAEFRDYVKNTLDGSPYTENKVELQEFLARNDRRGLRLLANVDSDSEATIQEDISSAPRLEFYFPVAAHRAAWQGAADVLVASALDDHEAPVAYDVKGRRQVLSADAPPVTPVLAVVPVETDFGGHVGLAITPPEPPPPSPAPTPTPPAGLYLTNIHFVGDFEGWLKGNPEYEIHILGQAGASDSLTDYQCAGEHAGGYYRFDQNSLNWSGSVLLFSQTQLNNYKLAHPQQNFRIVAVEDDDTACQIKLDANRFKNLQATLQAAYPDLTGSKDTVGSIGKFVKRANALQKILRAAYSFITTQDDLIGNAVEDVVAGQFITGANWIVKGENKVTNGWIKLEMR